MSEIGIRTFAKKKKSDHAIKKDDQKGHSHPSVNFNERGQIRIYTFQALSFICGMKRASSVQVNAFISNIMFLAARTF